MGTRLVLRPGPSNARTSHVGAGNRGWDKDVDVGAGTGPWKQGLGSETLKGVRDRPNFQALPLKDFEALRHPTRVHAHRNGSGVSPSPLTCHPHAPSERSHEPLQESFF